MLLLTNCEVHTGKYLDRSFEVLTERSEYVHTALDGPRINQSNREFLSCYTIMTVMVRDNE